MLQTVPDTFGPAEKADGRVGAGYLLHRRRKRHRCHPSQREQGNPKVRGLAHLDQDGRCQAQCDHAQQLIGNTEKWPKAVDATQRIENTLNEEISPRAYQ